MPVNLGLDGLLASVAAGVTERATGTATRFNSLLRSAFRYDDPVRVVADARVASSLTTFFTSANIAGASWSASFTRVDSGPLPSTALSLAIRLTKADSAKRLDFVLRAGSITVGGERWARVEPASPDATYDYFTTLLVPVYGLFRVEYRQNPFGSAATRDAGAASGNVPIIGSDGRLPSSVLSAASTSAAGAARFASAAEASAGTNQTRFVSPERMAAAGEKVVGICIALAATLHGGPESGFNVSGWVAVDTISPPGHRNIVITWAPGVQHHRAVISLRRTSRHQGSWSTIKAMDISGSSDVLSTTRRTRVQATLGCDIYVVAYG